MQPYSGISRRLIASIIDIFVIISLFMFLELITETIDEALFYILFFLAMWAYFVFQESSTLKSTVGKQAVNIIVTDLNGNRISFIQATKRFILKIFAVIPFFAGFLLILFTSKKQAFHDIIAKTLVFIQED
ncbi:MULTISPECIES: RDD family protein [Methanosarcina]|uniref:Serine/threonine protein kinase n=1 Tax=Methanosarcina vacuolata Z-761 TaxID=1434123 RepID=A0A0E3Q4K2_9EURY|nr:MULTISPECIES: RDD family protein [Methanosarcina]AKB44339.1 Serine/threonine protein kinase [Methanosarcina vacuolata Z-761]AKB47842.1 Serine/threonine protein kinase [Methanosarcina sp. Kolksee]MCC4766139.1 RDD family protein [Methanosarcina sp. DH1]